MIISAVSGSYVNNNYQQRPLKVREYCLNNIQKQNAKDVSFTGFSLVSIDKFAEKFVNPLKGFSQYSKEEYNTLSKTDLKILRSRFKHLSWSSKGNFYKNSEIIHDKASEAIRNGLDKKYGEGGYKVITIGRSLSSIGKVLGYKIGEENVINIPMSKCQRYMNPGYIDIIQKKGNIKPLEKFLCSKGLTRETVAESDKKLILMDYCCSGDSLKGAEALFKRIYQNSENICAENPMNFITDVSLENKLYRILRSCVYKPFSFVNRSVDLSDSPSSFVNVSKANYESRLMWFKLLDNFMLNKKSNIQDVRSDYQIWFL